ncbi:Oxygen-independent coproporphyrinogen III oxidase [compost metagenome]
MIQQLICHFKLDFANIEQAFAVDFRSYFAAIWPQLQQMAKDGLLRLSDQDIEVLPAGRLLVRSLCMLFDHYLCEQNQQRFSRVI